MMMIKWDRCRDTPRCCQGIKARSSDRNPACGLQQGQRSDVPSHQAEQMTSTCFDQLSSGDSLQNRGRPQMAAPLCHLTALTIPQITEILRDHRFGTGPRFWRNIRSRFRYWCRVMGRAWHWLLTCFDHCLILIYKNSLAKMLSYACWCCLIFRSSPFARTVGSCQKDLRSHSPRGDAARPVSTITSECRGPAA